MGNSLMDGASTHVGAVKIYTFYSPDAWIEGEAVEQLTQVASMSGVLKIAAFPDLHPGKYGPVGCAVLANRVYPHLIGNDIGCGMSLFKLGLPAHKVRVDKMAQQLRTLDGRWNGDVAARVVEAGLPRDCFPDALGTIGGGNHFCELQRVGEIFDVDAARAAGLAQDSLLLLIHSGSRALGSHVFGDVEQALDGFALGSAEADAYLTRHDEAVRWATLNRQIIAERAAEALRTEATLLCDAPHNLVEASGDCMLHRKGAAKADMALVPLAGSRDALSYLLAPNAVPNALASLAHGSGRKYNRRSMLGRVGKTKSDREGLARTSFGGRVICENRQLLIEEAAEAYKNPAHVVGDLAALDLARKVVSLQPLITFKKIAHEKKLERESKQRRLSGRRRMR